MHENFEKTNVLTFTENIYQLISGHVTGLALDAVHKMLSYELLHVDMKEIANAVENIADAVTHAR